MKITCKQAKHSISMLERKFTSYVFCGVSVCVSTIGTTYDTPSRNIYREKNHKVFFLPTICRAPTENRSNQKIRLYKFMFGIAHPPRKEINRKSRTSPRNGLVFRGGDKTLSPMKWITADCLRVGDTSPLTLFLLKNDYGMRKRRNEKKREIQFNFWDYGYIFRRLTSL